MSFDPFVEDLVTERHHLVDGVSCDEAESGLDRRRHVAGVLATRDPVLGLLPRETGHVADGEELALGQPSGQVEQRGAPHDRVVDVEERGGPWVEHDLLRRLGVLGGSLAGDDGRRAAALLAIVRRNPIHVLNPRRPGAHSAPSWRAVVHTRRAWGAPGRAVLAVPDSVDVTDGRPAHLAEYLCAGCRTPSEPPGAAGGGVASHLV